MAPKKDASTPDDEISKINRKKLAESILTIHVQNKLPAKKKSFFQSFKNQGGDDSGVTNEKPSSQPQRKR